MGLPPPLLLPPRQSTEPSAGLSPPVRDRSAVRKYAAWPCAPGRGAPVGAPARSRRSDEPIAPRIRRDATSVLISLRVGPGSFIGLVFSYSLRNPSRRMQKCISFCCRDGSAPEAIVAFGNTSNAMSGACHKTRSPEQARPARCKTQSTNRSEPRSCTGTLWHSTI